MAYTQHSPNARAYDLFKAIVAAILLIIIIILLLRAASAPRASAPATGMETASAPTLTLPDKPGASGSYAFKGTGTPGSKVELWADGKLLGSTTVGADGTWSLDADLPAGKHTLTARAVDASGKVLAESAPQSWEVPELPVVVAPALTLPEKANADGKFSLKGTGTPGSKVELWADGTLLGSTTVGADGTWSLDADLPAGKHTLQTRAVDASGKSLAESAPLSWEVPELPAVAAPALTLPEKANADGKFSLKGTGTPGSKVELWADGKLLGSTTVGADGTWSLDADLPAGKHTLQTRAVDASGKSLAESAPLSWEVPELPAVAAPALTLPEKANADGKFSLKGTGTPGSKVELWADGKLLGSTTVGADGTWSLDADLPAGKHTLTARAVDASGKVLAESAPLSWEVPQIPAVAPTLTLPAKVEAGQPVKLSGTGAPGAEIEIVEDGKVIGKAVVAADGTWSYSYTPAAGEHTLLVRAAGDTSLASASQKFSMPAPATAAPPATSGECGVGEDRGTTYVVARCEYMSLIAKRVGVTLAALIAANPEVTNPDLIYPGQILNLPPR